MQSLVTDTFLYSLAPFLSNADVMHMVVVDHHYHTILRDQVHALILNHHHEVLSHYRAFLTHMQTSTHMMNDVFQHIFKRTNRSVSKKRLALPLKSIH
jgi:hypothetical protein